MRALAFSLWVCAFLASSPALGQRFTDAQGVYDLWTTWLLASGEPEDIHLAETCDSAEEIYMETGFGFGSVNPLFAGRETINGTIRAENRLVWLDAFPILVGNFLQAVASVRPTILHRVPLSDLLSSIVPQLSSLPASSSSGFFVSYRGNYIDPSLQYGSLDSSAVRLTWSQAPIGVLAVEVLLLPYWYGEPSEIFVTPETYFQITHRWPLGFDSSRGRFIWLRDEIPAVFGTNVDVRVVESWN